MKKKTFSRTFNFGESPLSGTQICEKPFKVVEKKTNSIRNVGGVAFWNFKPYILDIIYSNVNENFKLKLSELQLK